MSTQYIILYAGLGVHMNPGYRIDLVRPEHATIYTSEAMAWFDAYKANLSPNRVSVAHRDTHLSQEPCGERSRTTSH